MSRPSTARRATTAAEARSRRTTTQDIRTAAEIRVRQVSTVSTAARSVPRTAPTKPDDQQSTRTAPAAASVREAFTPLR